MALYPRFRNELHTLNNTKVKVTSNSHNTPLQKGDIVMVRGNYYGSILNVHLCSSSNTDNFTKDYIKNETRFRINQRCLSIIEEHPNYPPIPEKKPRMSPKVLAELKRVKPCTDYVTQHCINLGYDFNLITNEQMSILISEFNKPDMKKGLINKMVADIFASIPKKEKLTLLSPEFDVFDSLLYNREESRKYSIPKYEKLVKDLTELGENEAFALKLAQDCLKKAKALPMDLVKGRNFTRNERALIQIKQALCKLVNSGTFYESFEIDKDSFGYDFEFLTINLFTKDVWLTEHENPNAPKINMGSYKVRWKPIKWFRNYDNVPDVNDDEEHDYDSDEFNYSSYVEDLANSIEVYEHKNNIKSESYIHPHVCSGNICWGNAFDSVTDALSYNNDFRFQDIEKAFITLAQLLKTYNSASPYHKLVFFRIAQNPSYLKLVPVVMEHRGSTTTISLSAKHTKKKMCNIDSSLINPVSIVKYLNSDLRTTSPERKNEHAYITVKLYQKYHQGLNNRPRGEGKIYYIKLNDNTFVPLDIGNNGIVTNTTNSDPYAVRVQIPF